MTRPVEQIVLVTVLYNSSQSVRGLWRCLIAQTGSDWRLIVVDNGATDDAGAYLLGQNDPRVQLVVNLTNEGFARGVNRGLRLALADGAERIILLNPDVMFEPDFFERYVSRWKETKAEVIAPRIMELSNPTVAWYAGGSLDFGWTFAVRHDAYNPGGPQSRLVDFASGCCLGLTRHILQDIGLLDERFFVYWEDADYCMRLKTAGYNVQYVAEPILYHEGGASSGGERSYAAQQLYYCSYAMLLKKHFGLRRALRIFGRVLVKARWGNGGQADDGRHIARAMLRGLMAKASPAGYLVPGTETH